MARAIYPLHGFLLPTVIIVLVTPHFGLINRKSFQTALGLWLQAKGMSACHGRWRESFEAHVILFWKMPSEKPD